jgi:hypothetical protein
MRSELFIVCELYSLPLKRQKKHIKVTSKYSNLLERKVYSAPDTHKSFAFAGHPAPACSPCVMSSSDQPHSGHAHPGALTRFKVFSEHRNSRVCSADTS